MPFLEKVDRNWNVDLPHNSQLVVDLDAASPISESKFYKITEN